MTSVIGQDQDQVAIVSWESSLQRGRFDSRLSGNRANGRARVVDPMIVEQLGKEHPLARHLDDFLIDAKNANASWHTLRAYRGDLLQFTAHCDGDWPT
jgi:hypothetical protein